MPPPREGLSIEPAPFLKGRRPRRTRRTRSASRLTQIVKSLVFLVDGAPTMALVAGDKRLDEKKLSAACGGGVVGRADADAVRAATGFPIGGVPPIGHDLPIYIDETLLRFDEVWAAAGTWTDNFAIAPDDLVRGQRRDGLRAGRIASGA